MTTYLVTGGAGFIGSHIVQALLERGARVRILDDLSTGTLDNVPRHGTDWEFIQGDICDPVTVRRATEGVDFVLHQAALASVPRSIGDPLATDEVNVRGTLQVLIAAREARVKRVVIASSSSVYGNSPALPKHEDMPTRPLSPYAVSKLAAESYGLAFHAAYGLPTVILRYFNVFGPRQNPDSQYAAVIPRFISALMRGDAPTIYGDGEQSRDFTYVSNVVTANLLACEAVEAVGQVINVAGASQISLLDLYALLSDLLAKDLPPIFAQARTGDVKHSRAAIDCAWTLLGYRPQVDWREGLRRTVDWFRARQTSVAGKSHG